jgi:hypothetical protein
MYLPSVLDTSAVGGHSVAWSSQEILRQLQKRVMESLRAISVLKGKASELAAGEATTAEDSSDR